MVGRVTLFIAAEGEAAYIMRTTESWIPGHASTADESGSSERELAYALTQSRLREATYEFAHRHRKRELDAYKNAVSDWKVFFGRKWLRKKVTGFIRAEEGQVRASGLLDPNWYCIRYPEAKRNPYLHYVTTGALDAADPHPLFDTGWYLKNNRFPRKSGINPLAHYITKGWRTGCSPHPLFDATWYMEEYPDVAQLGAEPLRYYITNGWQQGHRPSPLFDPQWYIERYPEVREGGMSPSPTS